MMSIGNRSSLTPLVPLALAAICLIGICWEGAAHAASFDCTKAATRVEKTVCADPILSRLDEELAESFRAAAGDRVSREKVIQDQKAWLSKRNHCTNHECLGQVYRDRLRVLVDIAGITPSEQQVAKRLSDQLAKLKALARERRVEGISASAGSDGAGERDATTTASEVCAAFWAGIDRAIVPKPDIFATKSAEKRALYARLRESAFFDKELITKDPGRIPNRKRYDTAFDRYWEKNKQLPEISSVRGDSVHVEFPAAEGSLTTARRPFAAVLLLDRRQDGITVRASRMTEKGMIFSPYTTTWATSTEWYQENDPELPHAGPSVLAGVLAIGTDIAGWFVNEIPQVSGQGTIVSIQPVRDSRANRDVQCVIDLK